MNQPAAFKDFFSNQLNAAQQKAVTHIKGPLLVIAGAGSGKTRVITARIAHLLLNQQIADDCILALTFTNKAAHEMKERVQHFIPAPINTFIGTFHSYCLQFLKRHNSYLSMPSFSILDTDDQYTLLTSIIKRAGLEKRISAKGLAYQISVYKNSQDTELFADQQLKEIVIRYEQEKKSSHCLDFDDLLLEVLALCKKYPQLIQNHQEQIRHILVDEYQDTNRTQHELLSLFTLKNDSLAIDSICAVGDEDQSIYSWRGATVENMTRFKKDFPHTKLIKIEQNYRSVQPILDVANMVISNNTQRTPKALWSEKTSSDRVRIIECFSNYHEGDVVAQCIKIVKQKNKNYSKAILYRAHYQSRALEEALIRHGITYKIIGGIQFYERKEIKDLLSYLRLIINPYDKLSFFRAINCPLRGLGDAFQEQFHRYWTAQPFTSFYECAETLIAQQHVTGTKKNRLLEFTDTIQAIPHDMTPHEALQKIIEKTNYITYLQHAFDKPETDSKIENIKELLRAAYHFEQRGLLTIDQFLQEVALLQQHDQDQQDAPECILMTLHSAKGLEFDCVIMCGLEEGVFPSNRSMHDPQSIEEERRLFYVGITRAREYLLLCHARHRSSFGTTTDQLPSRFLEEIPHNLAKRDQGVQWHELHAQAFFADWFKIKLHSDILTFGAHRTQKNSSEHHINQPSSLSEFKLHKPVNHQKFGVGIIKKIEKRDADKTFITVEFKVGIKVVESSYLKPL